MFSFSISHAWPLSGRLNTGLPLRINALTCFPWLLWTYYRFMYPCFAVSVKAKGKCSSISRAPHHGGYNYISSSMTWTWAFYSALPLNLSPSRLTLLLLLFKVGTYPHLFILWKLSMKYKNWDNIGSTSFSII